MAQWTWVNWFFLIGVGGICAVPYLYIVTRVVTRAIMRTIREHRRDEQ